MSGPYFDTTHLPAPDLTSARLKAEKQDDVVLSVFKALGRPAAPSEVLEASGLNAPITSIRRAISNLTDAGLLEKTVRQRMGPLGRPEYCRQIAAPQLHLFN